MVQHVAQHGQMVMSWLAGSDFLDCPLHEAHPVTRPIIEAPDTRCDVDSRDLRLRVRCGQPFGYCALAATHLQDAARGGCPLANLRGKLINVDVKPAVRVCDPTLMRPEHDAKHRTNVHTQKVPIKLARIRGVTRSTIRESRR